MEKFPYIIVGQGIAGTTLAFELEKAGLPFKIITDNTRFGASKVAAGIYNPLVFKRLVKSWMVDDVLPVALDTYSSLEKHFNTKFIHSLNILKPLSKQEHKLWEEKKEEDMLNNYISGVEAGTHYAGLHSFYGFGKVTQSGYLDTSLMLQTAFGHFVENKDLIQERFKYEDVSIEEGRVFWKKSQVAAIIFCKGSYSIYNPYFSFVKFTPTKGELLLIKAPELPQTHIYPKKVYILPVGKSRFKVGSTYDWDDFTNTPTVKGKESIEERLQDLISVPYTVEKHWAGVRPTVHDRRPVLGFHPEIPGIAMFNGMGTKGVMLAPYFAKEMVKIIQNRNYKIPPEVAVSRFWKS